jgi:RHS repeat-associated protein
MLTSNTVLPMMAASRLNSAIKINYAGSGNNSRFLYDAFERNVSISETNAGSITATTQFIWVGNDRCESRDNVGNTKSKYYSIGVNISGSAYFYTRDHLNSVRELTNNSGILQSQYVYDSQGNYFQPISSLSSDFQYAASFAHARSALNLTLARPYSPGLGRWLARDPISELGGINLYDYVRNKPLQKVDTLGYSCDGWGNGYGWGSDPSLGWGWTPAPPSDSAPAGAAPKPPILVISVPKRPPTPPAPNPPPKPTFDTCYDEPCCRRVFGDCARECDYYYRDELNIDCHQCCSATLLRCQNDVKHTGPGVFPGIFWQINCFKKPSNIPGIGTPPPDIGG